MSKIPMRVNERLHKEAKQLHEKLVSLGKNCTLEDAYQRIIIKKHKEPEWADPLDLLGWNFK